MVVQREEGEDLVQLNVRVPASLRDRIDARRAEVPNSKGKAGISRDEWIRRVAKNALDNPPTRPIRTPAGRSIRRTR